MGECMKIDKTALQGREIPILVLEHKWHQLLEKIPATPEMERLAEKLNELLKRQGKVNTETKSIKKLKKKLLDDIISLAGETSDTATEKKLEENRRLVTECNEKIEAYEDELLELPREIEQTNDELAAATMELCYTEIQKKESEIAEIAVWIESVRVELKKNLIRRQEKELFNQKVYSSMHDIFGAQVIEICDKFYHK